MSADLRTVLIGLDLWKPIDVRCPICRLWPEHLSSQSPHLPPTPLIPLPELIPALAWTILMAAQVFCKAITDQPRLHVRFALNDWFTSEDPNAEALVAALARALSQKENH